MAWGTINGARVDRAPPPEAGATVGGPGATICCAGIDVLGGATVGGAVTSTVFARTDFAVGKNPVAVVAQDLPYVDLWYIDNVVVHSGRVRNLELNPSGNYDFLKSVEIAE